MTTVEILLWVLGGIAVIASNAASMVISVDFCDDVFDYRVNNFLKVIGVLPPIGYCYITLITIFIIFILVVVLPIKETYDFFKKIRWNRNLSSGNQVPAPYEEDDEDESEENPLDDISEEDLVHSDTLHGGNTDTFDWMGWLSEKDKEEKKKSGQLKKKKFIKGLL